MKNTKHEKPPGSFLKPEFQVTTVSTHRSVAAFKIAADTPDEAKQIAEKLVEKSILIYPAEDLGIPQGVTDSIGHTGLKESSVVGVMPALKKGGFDLTALPELLGINKPNR
ncbi:MAG TPA: hypothetical protein VFE51_11200 [Verrucomicrobiae bacterium]|nr:hypothetical protein [Verrucomicrobiae bacterium]